MSVASFAVTALHYMALMVQGLRGMEKKFDLFLVEHEMLMSDYAKQRNMSVSDLPTRSVKKNFPL